MEYVVFTLTAVLLYLVADWIVNRIEIYRGERLEHRSILFFAIILALAFLSFNLLEQLFKPLEEPANTTESTVSQSATDS